MDTPDAPKDAIDAVFARLGDCPIRVAIPYFANEVQQTVAAVLLESPPEWAAAVLSGLPHFFRHDVLACMARSRLMHPAARHALAKVLEHELLPGRPVPEARGDQVRRIVAMMAPELRESAEVVVEEAAEGHQVAPPSPAPQRASHPFADPLPPSTKTLPRVTEHMDEFERIPMLEVVYDRMVRRMSTTLRSLTGENVEVRLDQLSWIRNDDYEAALPAAPLSSVFASADGSMLGQLVVDRNFMQSVVEPMLGGRSRANEAMRWQSRPVTTIERDLFALAASAILGDLSAAFSSVMEPVEFRLDRIETNKRFAAIAPPTEAMVAARGRINFGEYGGRWDVLFSHAVIDRRRDVLMPLIPPTPTRGRPGRAQAA
jgi:hypothetical protein